MRETGELWKPRVIREGGQNYIFDSRVQYGSI